MDGLFATMRRLHERGPRSRGLSVDAEGVVLGPDCVLVRRTSLGYRRANVGEIADLTRAVFGRDARLDRIPIVLTRITEALADGDLVKAQLLGLEIPINDLDDRQLARLRHTGDLVKEYDPNQPRDEQGRWTNHGEGPSSSVREAFSAAGFLIRQTPLPPVLPWALRVLSGPVAFFGTLLVPTNRSNVSEGTIPDSPGLAYRNDEGVLTLYHVDDDGHRTIIFNGLSGADHLYRDEQGNIIGRNIGSGQGFIIDPGALPKLAEKIDGVKNPEYRAQLQAYVDAVMKSDPRLCPLPSRDRGSNDSKQAGLYQSQVCGLPPDWGVLFNGVRYDGCDPPTGILKECKALGFADKMIGEPSDNWPWPDWFTKNPKKGMTAIVDEMRRQSVAAGVRMVDWHVAEKPFADWLDFYAKTQGYGNIRVYWTPPSAEVRELHRKAMEAAGQWVSGVLTL
jgi:hypothetical protein